MRLPLPMRLGIALAHIKRVLGWVSLLGSIQLGEAMGIKNQGQRSTEVNELRHHCLFSSQYTWSFFAILCLSAQ